MSDTYALNVIISRKRCKSRYYYYRQPWRSNM